MGQKVRSRLHACRMPWSGTHTARNAGSAVSTGEGALGLIHMYTDTGGRACVCRNVQCAARMCRYARKGVHRCLKVASRLHLCRNMLGIKSTRMAMLGSGFRHAAMVGMEYMEATTLGVTVSWLSLSLLELRCRVILTTA